MTYKTRGEAQVGHGLGLGRFTTAERVAYIPPQSGFLVYDTDLSHVFEWDGTTWIIMGNGRYVRPADGSTLIAGLRYIVTTETVNTPASPVDGDFFYLRNDGSMLTGGDLDRGIIVGPLQTMQGDNIPGFTIAPGLEYLATYDATAGRWKVALWAPMVTVLDGTNNGQELRSIGIYEIKGDVPGLVFKLPATPAGSIDIRLQAGSAFPVTITQFDTGLPDQFLFENSQTGDSFVIETAHAGQKTEISGDPGTNTWHAYRDWEIANINNNATPWQPNTPYVVGDLVTANRLSDGKLTIFSWDDSVNNGGTPTDGISGAGTFDIVEEARWIEIGEAEITLEVLQTVEVTVRGYFTSFTIATDLVLIDGAGNDYDSATDWKIVGDTLGLLDDGRLLGNSSFAPPVNDSRTLTLQYSGPTTRRGLSAVRATYRADAATTGLTVVKTKYFSGVSETFTSTGALLGTQTVVLTDTFDFLTNPQLANELNVQYMTTASGLFWYSRDNFRPNELITLVTDSDDHQLTISNNSGLQGLKVIDIDGTVTETVNPALQGSTNSVDLDPSSIYHAWVDDAPVLYVVKVGPADRQIATIANEAALTALLETTLGDGDGKSIGSDLWVWHDAMTPAEAAEFDVLEPDDKVNPGVDNGYWVLQDDPGIEVVFPGSGVAQATNTRNVYWLDEAVGAPPTAAANEMYFTGVVQVNKDLFDPLAPDVTVWTQYVAVEDDAAPGTYYWSSEGQTTEGGDTRFTFFASDRLELFNFTIADRRPSLRDIRQERHGLNVDELSTGTAEWVLDPGNAPAGFTRLIHRLEANATVGYDFTLDWQLVNGEYRFIFEDNHNSTLGSNWGTNRYGGVYDIVLKSFAVDPPRAQWTALTTYNAADIVIGTAPAGVPETDGEKYFIEAPVGGRPNTVAALDAAEWALWTIIGPLVISGSGERTVDGATVETLHSYTVREGESQVFIVPGGVTQEFRLNGDPVNVSVENQAGASHVEVDNGVIDKTITLTGPARLTYTPGNILTESLAPSVGGVETIADQATLTALPEVSLVDGEGQSINNNLWVWHEAATAAEVANLDALEPDDKANPGVDPGYWIKQSDTSATNVAPTFVIGGKWVVTHRDDIHLGILPLDGQTVANFDTLYPDLWAKIQARGLPMWGIQSFNAGTGEVVLKNYNGEGRFGRAGATGGVEQDHALQNHAHRVKTNSAVSSPNATNNNARAGWNGVLWDSRDGLGAEDIYAPQGQPTPNVADETRPINVSEVWCIIVQPWTVTGNAADISASSIDALNDVDTTTTPPVNDQVLAFDGTNWVPTTSSSVSMALDVWNGDGSTTSGIANNGVLERPTELTHIGTGITLTGTNEWTLSAGTWELISEGFSRQNNTTSNGGHRWQEDGVNVGSFGSSSASGGTSSNISGERAVAYVEVPEGQTKVVRRANLSGATTSNGSRGQVSIKRIGQPAAAGADISASSIDALNDVDTTTAPPTNGQGLVWDGANWVPGTGVVGSPLNRARMTGPPSALGNATANLLALDTIVDQVGTGASLATNQYIVPADGWYQAAATVSGVSSLSSFVLVGLIRQNAIALTTENAEISIGTGYSISLSAGAFFATAGDTIDVQGAAFSTSAENASTILSVIQIADASLILPDSVPVDNTGVADGNVLVWNNANNQYEPGVAGASNINALTDVDTATAPPTTGQTLEWDGASWVPANGVGPLGDLTDVTINAPASAHTIVRNGANDGWVNGPVPAVTRQKFFTIDEADNEVFTDGQIVMVTDNQTDAQGHAYMFFDGATEGDYEIANNSDGFLNRLDGNTVNYELEEDLGNDNVVSFSAADDDFGDGFNDLDTTFQIYLIKRHDNSTAVQSYQSGSTIIHTVAANDFEWHAFRRINTNTVAYMGQITGGAETSSGLRGEPVANAIALTALPAREFERRLTKDNNTEYVFKLTADLTAGEIANPLNLDDDAVTGKWVEQDRLLTTSEIGVGTIWSSLTLTGKPDEVILDGETFNNAQYPELAALAATMDVIVDNANGTSTVSFADYFPRPATINIGNKVEDSFESHNHAGGKSVFGAEAAFGTTGNFGGGNNQTSNWDSASGLKPLTSSIGGSETAPKHFGAFFGVYGRAGKAVVEADLVGVEDEPASYDRLYGNVFNSGGTNFPGDTFVPTVTGVYEFINELGITGNEVWANLATVSGGNNLINNGGSRLNDSLERTSTDITLNAGTTYHIATSAGGSTGRSSLRVVIRLKNYVRKGVVGPDAAIDDLTDVDTTTTPPANDQVLAWDGTNWVPVTPTANAPYIHNFDGTLDWGAAAGGLYTITVPAATHGITNPYLVQPWQISGPGDFDFVTSSQLRIMFNGDIVISVSAVPDARFPGRVVIS